MTDITSVDIPGGNLPPALALALLRIAALEWQEAAPAVVLEAAEVSLGLYTGLPAQIVLLPDGRSAKLLQPILYRDPSGLDWPVPAGSDLDGASIPRAFWTLIGGPFEGKYRDASIVHDRYCVQKTRTWKSTHRMFYDAMRCSGVAKAKAKVMYYAVYRFGPRWPLAGTVSESGEARSVEGAAVSLAADAEAIYVHDLGLEEIERLADARNAEASRVRPESVEIESVQADQVERLVIAAGSGDGEDLKVVAHAATLLPTYVLDRFEANKIRLVACRNSVTDFERDLRGVVPRGWERTGRTWDSVPGAYFPDRKRVVIATIQSAGMRAVPGRGTGLHGSHSLVAHESLHGYDHASGQVSHVDARFRAAHDADLDKLDAYEQQPGAAGLEETYAESGARFIVDGERLQAEWPALYAYWLAAPQPLSLEPITGAAPAVEAALGTAELGVDEAIHLDLRAELESGAIGHAQLRIAPDDAAYPALRAHLFGADSRQETSGVRRVLFHA